MTPLPGLGRVPVSTRSPSAADELDAFVRAFEEAYLERGGADLAAFLPPTGHRLYVDVLRELVRVDLEFAWERGRPRPLETYRREFPALGNDAEGLREVAYEEFRLRRQAGQAPSADEYRERYGLTIEPSDRRPAPPSLPRSGAGTGARRANPRFPEVGDEYLGFRLVGALGRGAFGRVFLAHQTDLADRTVVLKVTADGRDEALTLAQLHHDHIVPVYSRHSDGALRAVCMPYLGAATLRDLIDDFKSRGGPPGSGRELVEGLARSSEQRHPASAGGAGAGSRTGPDGAPSSGGEKRGPVDHPEGWVGGAAAVRSGDQDGAPGRVATTAGLPAGTPDARAALGKLSYVGAVVWMTSRLAHGLAHAHERGILHRDLKPANILLADDGRPMLLDFNLAADLKDPADDDVGGTLPYMAPEHLEAFGGGGGRLDGRCDVFALGVILYELLAGRPPFPVREPVRGDRRRLRQMADDRRGAPPLVRPFNPEVSPAVESVVRHCLQPDPARRYPSARALAEDLERHLAHRPLRYAPDPSHRERAAKWVRRHALALTAGAVLAAVGGPTAAVKAYHDRFEAADAVAAFHSHEAAARARLAEGLSVPSRQAEGLTAARRALAVFHVLDDLPVPWWERPPAARLDATARRLIRREAGELLLLMYQYVAPPWRPESPADAAAGPDVDPRAGADLLARASRCFEPGTASFLVAFHEEELHRARPGRVGSEPAGRPWSPRVPPTDARGFYLLGNAFAVQGRDADALRQFGEAVRLDPSYYWAWLGEGLCHLRLQEEERALSDFNTCVALDQKNPAGWAFRAQVSLKQGRTHEAAADLDRAIALGADTAEVLTDRAAVDLLQGRPGEAVGRLTRLVDAGRADPRVYLVRSEAYARAGDAPRSQRDWETAVEFTPADAAGWFVRAAALSKRGRYDVALAALDEALRTRPDAFEPLWNKAHVLSQTGRTAEAVAVLDRVADLNPARGRVRGCRGVLHARLGHRDAAVADVEEAVALTPSPENYYFAACAYALNSRSHPDDRSAALRMLDLAFRKKLPPEVVDADADVDALRGDPEFRRLVAAARSAGAARTAPPTPSAPATRTTRPDRSTNDRPGPATTAGPC